jgi:hypothetical protein
MPGGFLLFSIIPEVLVKIFNVFKLFKMQAGSCNDQANTNRNKVEIFQSSN